MQGVPQATSTVSKSSDRQTHMGLPALCFHPLLVTSFPVSQREPSHKCLDISDFQSTDGLSLAAVEYKVRSFHWLNRTGCIKRFEYLNKARNPYYLWVSDKTQYEMPKSRMRSCEYAGESGKMLINCSNTDRFYYFFYCFMLTNSFLHIILHSSS